MSFIIAFLCLCLYVSLFLLCAGETRTLCMLDKSSWLSYILSYPFNILLKKKRKLKQMTKILTSSWLRAVIIGNYF